MKADITTSKRAESIKMTKTKSKEHVPNDFENLAVTFHRVRILRMDLLWIQPHIKKSV